MSEIKKAIVVVVCMIVFVFTPLALFAHLNFAAGAESNAVYILLVVLASAIIIPVLFYFDRRSRKDRGGGQIRHLDLGEPISRIRR